MIVRTTNKYDAEVYVEKGTEQVNGKSIMGLMMLAAGPGSKLRFIVIGERAEELLAELTTIFEKQFEEA
jgi:phosphocarrier protein